MTYKQDSNILYIFGSGRAKRINEKSIDSEEFFYGYFYLKKTYQNLDYIEMRKEERPSEISKKFLLFIDKVLRKLTNLPFYTNLICSIENYKKIKNANTIVSTNDRLALSILPMVWFGRVTSNIKLNVIVMGLFSNKKSSFILNIFHKFLIFIILNSVNKFIFLGLGEFKNASTNYKKYEKKFFFLPFCVDSKFWNNPENNYPNGDSILFIGNDGNREFDIAVKIAEKLPSINFNFVTSYKYDEISFPKNIKLISANWNEYLLSDKEIRNYYLNSKLTILPLKNTLQPSGQSVTLQSMSVGTPVLITKTKGFWDNEKFEDNKNIFFIDNNDVDNWIKKIVSIYENEYLLKTVSKNSIKTINENYDINLFNNNLEEILLS
tara:strand:- start:2012 stop:3148 length:1137 start_codon:yes stop_codon:yes gene_type:complete